MIEPGALVRDRLAGFEKGLREAVRGYAGARELFITAASLLTPSTICSLVG